MKLKRQAIAASTVVLLGISGMIAVWSSSAVSQTSTQASRVKLLMQHLAQLEVEKTLESVRFTSENPVIIKLNREQAALQQQLQDLDPRVERQSEVVTLAAQAIRIKIGEIEAEYDRARARFTDDSYLQQRRRSQLRFLRERLTQLQQSSLRSL